jgi:hypothetical protein
MAGQYLTCVVLERAGSPEGRRVVLNRHGLVGSLLDPARGPNYEMRLFEQRSVCRIGFFE